MTTEEAIKNPNAESPKRDRLSIRETAEAGLKRRAERDRIRRELLDLANQHQKMFAKILELSQAVYDLEK